MSTQLNKLIEYANSTVGITESPMGSNNVIFNTKFYGTPVSGAPYPWCCSYIWSIFNDVGLSHIFCGGKKTASCPEVKRWAINNKRLSRTISNIGDLVLLNFSEKNH